MIVLKRQRWTGVILATHTGPDRDRITELFNTDTLPTPYILADPMDVAARASILAGIQRLNPDKLVLWNTTPAKEAM